MKTFKSCDSYILKIYMLLSEIEKKYGKIKSFKYECDNKVDVICVDKPNEVMRFSL